MLSRDSLTRYFLIAYLFTWVFHLAIPALGYEFTLDFSNPSTSLYLIGILGPLVAAMAVMARTRGKAGIRSLLITSLAQKFNPLWALVAVGLAPLLMTIHLMLTGNLGRLSQFVQIPWLLVIGQIWIVAGEEYGWRGFALPRAGLYIRLSSCNQHLIRIGGRHGF